MRAMVLVEPGPVETSPLKLLDISRPMPGDEELLIRVEVCGVCRTDLHVVERDLPPHRNRIIPGHEVIGRVERLGSGCELYREGDRVGVAWLHRSCGVCTYCTRGEENLCDSPTFTGYDANGGYAEYIVALEAFVYPIPEIVNPIEAAPFLCAGIIGYRALRRSEIRPGETLGLYGFGGSAHIVIQIARHWGCEVYVCTRGASHQELALQMGAVWAGAADEMPPCKLRAAILFAPVGDLVLPALRALDKGGTLAVAEIHLSNIPEMEYQAHLFQEKTLRSVTANTRQDGKELLTLAAEIPLHSHTKLYPLDQANEALQKLKNDGIDGTAVLRI